MKWKKVLGLGMAAALVFHSSLTLAAYNHNGESDSANFRAAYPAKVGTKLDSCALCHGGGSYTTTTSSGTTTTNLGSCQWCHYTYGYDKKGDITKTLNAYGQDYLRAGRSQNAIVTINSKDSDGDGYSNADEISANSFPGSSTDNPKSVAAPCRIISRSELETLTQYSQLLLMNSTKSGDYYANYSGVTIETLLAAVGALDTATGVTVYSPDGFSQLHPFDPLTARANSVYPVGLTYPQATYRYNVQADVAKSSVGWCDYSSPGVQGLKEGDAIVNSNGLRLLLAYKRDGAYLPAGVLTSANKLDGEGPFRVITPQVVPAPPDQASNSSHQTVVWPYASTSDHNAGFSTRSVTMIRVEPLPAGTTDIDVMEAGWSNIDSNKIIVYGSIDSTSATLNHAKGSIKCQPSAGSITNSEIMTMDDARLPSQKPNADFPYGAVRFDIKGISTGGSVNVVISFPEQVPPSAKYYKAGSAGTWNEIPYTLNNDGKSITITLTDGDASTDADGLANGTIVDPGALGLPATASSASSTSSVSQSSDGGSGGGGGCVYSARGDWPLDLLALLFAAAALAARHVRLRKGRAD